MVSPTIIAAGIGAVASLFGGRADRKAQREANEANLPVNQVRQWEAAGINPTFGISQGQWVPQQAASMGDAFASAGSYLAEGVNLDHQEKLKETALRKENEDLRKKLVSRSKPNEPSNMAKTGIDVPHLRDESDLDGVVGRAGPYNGRPVARPTASDERRVPVFLPDGQPRSVPKGVADRQGIAAFTSMAPGEYTELVGEIRGEGESVILASEIGLNMGVPLFGLPEPEVEPGAEPLKADKSVLDLFNFPFFQ